MRPRVQLGVCACLWKPTCVSIFSLTVTRSHGHRLDTEDQRNDIYGRTVNKWLNRKLRLLKLCYTPTPLETPAGLALNTHLARITSYPSKIFHYHSIEDVKGTVITRTLQGWLSTLTAVRVGKSPVCGSVWLLPFIFLPSFAFLQWGLITCKLWPHPSCLIDQ